MKWRSSRYSNVLSNHALNLQSNLSNWIKSYNMWNLPSKCWESAAIKLNSKSNYKHLQICKSRLPRVGSKTNRIKLGHLTAHLHEVLRFGGLCLWMVQRLGSIVSTTIHKSSPNLPRSEQREQKIVKLIASSLVPCSLIGCL